MIDEIRTLTANVIRSKLHILIEPQMRESQMIGAFVFIYFYGEATLPLQLSIESRTLVVLFPEKSPKLQGKDITTRTNRAYAYNDQTTESIHIMG